MPSFDIQGARKAGYSDAEIASKLAEKNSFNLTGAKAAGYTDAEIAEKLSGYEPVGVAEDVAKTAPSAIAKGAIAAPLWLADVGNLAMQGVARGVGYGYDAVSEENLTPDQWQKLKSVKPFYGSQDAITAAEDVTGVDFYDPQTRLGKGVDTAVQFAVGNKAAGGGIKPGLMAGGASEAAGQATEGTALEAPARIGTAMLTGTIAERNNLLRSNAGTQAKLGLKDITQQQMDDATKLIDDAQAMGVTLTPAEAIAQVTDNKGQPLLTLQRRVETSPQTSARMGEYMGKRPGQNQAAVDDYLQMQVGEPANLPAVPAQTQRTAEAVVKGIENKRTMAASPYYEAANPVAVDEAAVSNILAKIDAAAQTAPSSVRAQLIALKADIQSAGKTVGGLDTVRKLYRDKATAPEISATGMEKTTAAQVMPFIDDINTVLESASNEFRRGKAAYQAATPQVDLVNASPVGKMARSNPDAQNAIGQQFDDLVKSDSARPQDVAEAVRKLAAVNPEAPQNLIGAGLRMEWEKASKDLVSGSNQSSGAKFAASVGNPKVRAGLEALPGGAEAVKGFDILMDAFGAQGKRLPVSSPTAEKGALQQAIEKGGVLGTLAAPIKTVKDAVADFRSSKADEQILEALTAPDGIAKLQELAKVGAASPRGQALLRTFIMGGKANEMAGPEPAEVTPAQEQPTQPQPVILKPQAATSEPDAIIASLTKAEGIRPQSYTDTTGHKTIGIGFNMDTPNARKVWQQAEISTPFGKAYDGQASLSKEEINRLAMASQLMAEKDVKQLVPGYSTLSPNRQEALLHMAYQLGKPRMAEFKNMLGSVKKGNFELAAKHLLDSKYARQTPERVRTLANMLANDAPYGA